jgi:hypothetical protein
MENFKTIKPTIHGNVVVLDKADYDRMEAVYAILASDLENADKQINDGEFVTADSVFTKLREKYGYKV